MFSDGVNNSCMPDWEHKLIENYGSLINGKKEADTLREEFQCLLYSRTKNDLVYDEFQSLYS